MGPERGGARVLEDGVVDSVGGLGDVEGGNGEGVVGVGVVAVAVVVGGGREEGVEVGGG